MAVLLSVGSATDVIMLLRIVTMLPAPMHNNKLDKLVSLIEKMMEKYEDLEKKLNQVEIANVSVQLLYRNSLDIHCKHTASHPHDGVYVH